jgi:hypothetical protein
LYTQNNSMTIDLSKDDLDDHYRDYWADTFVRPKQVIYCPNFVTRRRRRLCNIMFSKRARFRIILISALCDTG